jgi:hypothetical protein
MKTVFTFGGSNPYAPSKDALIELRQSDDKQARFILSYGCEVKPGLTYTQAARALGEAILHHLACESIVNNEGV